MTAKSRKKKGKAAITTTMDGSGAILCQISSLKEMLDQVNEEMEENIQITREIESEIFKCSETEVALAARESDLTKISYVLQFELTGLAVVTKDSRASVKELDEEICLLSLKRDQLQGRINHRRQQFISSCRDFQRSIGKGNSAEAESLLAEKERLENEFRELEKKNNALRNSMSAFVEEILEDVQSSNADLQAEIRSANLENEKLQKEIEDLKTKMMILNY